MSLIQQLNDLAPEQQITWHVQYGELPLLVIHHPECEAIISLQGAQLLHWQPKQTDKPVFWLSDASKFEMNTPIRGGVPICWPWFADAHSPMHGFARRMMWEITKTEIDDDAVVVALQLTANHITKAFIPNDFTVTMTMTLGRTCDLRLTVEGDIESTAALHSYFTVDAIQQTLVNGLGATYHDKLDQPNLPKVDGEMIFDQNVDRIYTDPKSQQHIIDSSRTLRLTSYHVSDVVTWNPWIDKAKEMSDLHDDDYLRFVCVESARLHEPLIATPDASVSFGVTVEVI